MISLCGLSRDMMWLRNELENHKKKDYLLLRDGKLETKRYIRIILLKKKVELFEAKQKQQKKKAKEKNVLLGMGKSTELHESQRDKKSPEQESAAAAATKREEVIGPAITCSQSKPSVFGCICVHNGCVCVNNHSSSSASSFLACICMVGCRCRCRCCVCVRVKWNTVCASRRNGHREFRQFSQFRRRKNKTSFYNSTICCVARPKVCSFLSSLAISVGTNSLYEFLYDLRFNHLYIHILAACFYNTRKKKPVWILFV